MPGPRRPRLLLPGVAVHLIQRGVDRSPCFFDDDDRRTYLDELRILAAETGCAIHGYVLMDNHVHLLLTPETASAPSQLMQRLGRRYVRRVNDAYGRTGTLWEGRFRSCIAEDERYVLACQRYIELNPVRAFMVAHPRDYPWSSYRANAEGAPSSLLTPHADYLALGATAEARRAAWTALVAERIDAAETEAIRAATAGNRPLGSERFQRQIEAMLGRRIMPGRPGRKPAAT